MLFENIWITVAFFPTNVYIVLDQYEILLNMRFLKTFLVYDVLIYLAQSLEFMLNFTISLLLQKIKQKKQKKNGGNEPWRLETKELIAANFRLHPGELLLEKTLMFY